MNVNATIAMDNVTSNIASDVSPLATFLGRAAYEAHLIRPLLPTYIHLIASALFPIWLASHASLVRPSSAAKLVVKASNSEYDDDEPEEVSQKLENLSPSDAVLFPLFAGVTLASLYVVLKYFDDPQWLNWGMNIYFSQMGFFFSYRFLADAFATVRSAIFPRYYTWRGALWELDNTKGGRYTRKTSEEGQKVEHTSPFPGALRVVPLPGFVKRFIWSYREGISRKATLTLHLRGLVTLRATPTWLDFKALAVAAVLIYIHTFVEKPWQLTNFLGLSFCYGSLQLTSPSTAWTGTLLLSGLFFYDIYMVFFTPMMVHVATNLDVPIKMLFPRPDGCVYPAGAEEGSAAMEQYQKCLGKKRGMAMLGLGDIVVPGLIMAFALRWDLWLHYLKLQKKSSVPDDTSVDGTAKVKTNVITEAYRPATGGWGERFWTAASLRPAGLRAKTFKKTYFHATVVGYVLGMCTTVGVMQVAKHAQPALLYLVPGVLGALWGTAFVKGEVKLLWNYVEDDGEDKTNKKEKKEDEGNNEGGKKALQNESSTSDESRALVEPGPSKKSKAGPEKEANEGDHDEDDMLKAEVRMEMKRVRQHAIYFTLKLPCSSPSSSLSKKDKKKDKKGKSKDVDATKAKESDQSAEEETKVVDSTDDRSPSPSDSPPASRNQDNHAGTDDAEDEDVTKIKSSPTASVSRRVLRSSGAADVLGGWTRRGSGWRSGDARLEVTH